MEDDFQNNQLYHVVLVWRSGQSYSNLYLMGPGSKRRVRVKGEEVFRTKHKLGHNIALLTNILYSGIKEEATEFFHALEAKIDEHEKEAL